MNNETSKKIRAILVGGLVVGVGAAMTLATWNDSEFAQKEFKAGTLVLESRTVNVDGDFIDSSKSGESAQLRFPVTVDNLSPGDTVYAPFAIRLSDKTSYNAKVNIIAGYGEPTDALAPAGLKYNLFKTATFDEGCDSNSTPLEADMLVSAGSDLYTAPGSLYLEKGLGTEPGSEINMCFAVTADDGLIQGQTATVTWEFKASSNPDS